MRNTHLVEQGILDDGEVRVDELPDHLDLHLLLLSAQNTSQCATGTTGGEGTCWSPSGLAKEGEEGG